MLVGQVEKDAGRLIVGIDVWLQVEQPERLAQPGPVLAGNVQDLHMYGAIFLNGLLDERDLRLKNPCLDEQVCVVSQHAESLAWLDVVAQLDQQFSHFEEL